MNVWMPVVSNTADTPNPPRLLPLSDPYKGNLGVPTGEGKSSKCFLAWGNRQFANEL